MRLTYFKRAQSRQKQVGCFGRGAGDPFTFNGRALMLLIVSSGGGLRSKNSRPGELTASGAHDLAPKEKRDSVHYGGPSCIPSPPNGNPLRWRHLTEISRSACWTMMVSSIRSHLRVTRTGPIGSTLGVRGTSISSRPIGATGVNSTSRRAEQPRKLQDGTCESRAICWRGRQRLSASTPITQILVALVLAAIAHWPTARTTQLTYSRCDPQNISFRQPTGRPPDAEIAQKAHRAFQGPSPLLRRMSPW